jgi:hypothetical protein
MTPHEQNISLPPPVKSCYRCLRVKPLTDFGVNNGRKDGLKHICKSCVSEIYKAKPKIKYVAKDLTIDIMCFTCGISKKATEFYPKSSAKSGLSSNCKECDRKIHNEYVRKNYDAHRKRVKKYKTSHPERIKLQGKIWREKVPNRSKITRTRLKMENPRYDRDQWLRKRHGVTQEWYEQRLAAQHGGCDICGTTEPGNFG